MASYERVALDGGDSVARDPTFCVRPHLALHNCTSLGSTAD